MTHSALSMLAFDRSRAPLSILGSALLLALVACAQGASSNGDAGTGVDVPTGSSCGDGVRNGTDECEGTDLAGATCISLGYASGELACSAACSFDKSACVNTVTSCGNGVRDDGEQCDSVDLGGATCADVGFVAGNLGCDAACQLDTSGCTTCGDGRVQAGDECDGEDFGGQSCTELGFNGGDLACTASCGFDTEGCYNADCGDGTQNGDEDCDGTDLADRVCANLGFFAGTLGCDSSCRFDTSGCTNCGNGAIEGVEQCDGSELGTATCASAGDFTSGTLRCAADCTYDTSSCVAGACGNGTLESGEACDDDNVIDGDGCDSDCDVETGWSCSGSPSSCSAICGDGLIRGAEQCEGSDLAGASCTTLGYVGGTLSCSSSCQLVTTACTTTSCGNGTIDTGEECDDGGTTAYDGCDTSCQVEDNFYLPVRLRGSSALGNEGIVEVYYSGTWRSVCDDMSSTDRINFANVVCAELGYTGTGHTVTTNNTGIGTPLMDEVNCLGTEDTLAQCPFDGWNVGSCGVAEAVGLVCVPGEGDIRLNDGPSSMEGLLQIYHDGAWDEVCDDYIQYTTGVGPLTQDTICQQLGYARGSFLSTYDAPDSVFSLDDVQCSGTERRIADCPHATWGSENCSYTEGTGILCELYAAGDSRLVAGTSRNHGRVEVLHSNVWGTVCDDGISYSGTYQTNAMSVLCTELGYSSGTFISSPRIPGVEPVWMDDVRCVGSEGRIGDCPFSGWGVENCSHSEDTVVTCTP